MGIKFGDWAPNCHCKNTGGFKFGGVVRHCHTYTGKYEVLADFYLVVAKTDRQFAKFHSLPNFPAIWYWCLERDNTNLGQKVSKLFSASLAP